MLLLWRSLLIAVKIPGVRFISTLWAILVRLQSWLVISRYNCHLICLTRVFWTLPWHFMDIHVQTTLSCANTTLWTFFPLIIRPLPALRLSGLSDMVLRLSISPGRGFCRTSMPRESGKHCCWWCTCASQEQSRCLNGFWKTFMTEEQCKSTAKAGTQKSFWSVFLPWTHPSPMAPWDVSYMVQLCFLQAFTTSRILSGTVTSALVSHFRSEAVILLWHMGFLVPMHGHLWFSCFDPLLAAPFSDALSLWHERIAGACFSILPLSQVLIRRWQVIPFSFLSFTHNFRTRH